MLHLRSSNGFENIFSLDVYSRVFSNTISNFGRQNANTRQYTPNFNSDFTGTSYYLLLIEQATQKEYFQNSENGVKPTIIPNSISYNG